MATQPDFIPMPFAYNGDRNTLPSDSDEALASWSRGFPPITSTQIIAGGVAPKRMDFNGAFYDLSSHTCFQQAGGIYSYSSELNYDPPALVYDAEDQRYYYCVKANGPSYSVVAPHEDSSRSYWTPASLGDNLSDLSDPEEARKNLGVPSTEEILDAVYPVGSIYVSVNATNPGTLFGIGTWEQIQGRFILGVNNDYAAESTGGEASHTLTTSELPAHNHSASTASGGAHNHSATIASGGAHTHTGTAASAGSHTHTGTAASAGDHCHGTVGETENSRITAPWGVYGDVDNTHIGLGSSDRNNSFWNSSTEGAHTHSLTINSAGAHTHTVTIASGGSHSHTATIASGGDHTHTVTVDNTGSGEAHNNMPPYFAAYIWRRTA